MQQSHLLDLAHELSHRLAGRVHNKLSSSNVIVPHAGAAAHVGIDATLPAPHMCMNHMHESHVQIRWLHVDGTLVRSSLSNDPLPDLKLLMLATCQVRLGSCHLEHAASKRRLACSNESCF